MIAPRFDARLLNVVIFTGGMLLLALVSVEFARTMQALPSAAHVAMWIGLMSAAVLFPVPRRGRGAPATMSSALEFGALLVFGAPIACWLAMVSRLVGHRQRLRNARTLGDMGRSVASIVSAGRVYQALGGTIGTAFELHWGSTFTLLVAGGVFLTVFEGLPFLAGFLGLREPMRLRLAALRDEAVWQASLLPFGVPAAFVQFHLGLLGGAVIGLPLLIAARARLVWDDAGRGHVEATRTLMTALDSRDPFTRGHSYRISKMSVRVGRHLGLDDYALAELEYAALLHDVGRTAVPAELLPRNPSLNVEQQSVLRRHPERGGEIVARFGFYPGAADIVRSHHEQPDGQGYPAGLRDGDIPVGSLVIMVVAAFDAMTSDRPYRRGLEPEAALEELRANAGSQFSAAVVEALVTLYANGALFDDFAAQVLEQYARGEGNSRAIYEHLARAGAIQPSVRAGFDALIGAEQVPELELPDSNDLENATTANTQECEMQLGAGGAWRFDVAARTDVGCVRENNEDAFGVFETDAKAQCLLVIADGMGGAAAGEVASRLAVDTVHTMFVPACASGSIDTALRSAIHDANEAIRDRAAQNDELYGMGTTCVAATVSDMRLYVGHVGDSRAYLAGPDGIRQITRDHNLAEELKCVVGAEGPEGAQHVLTRSLGSRSGVDVDVSEAIQLREHHVLVLCSDGLSNLVSAEEILDAVSDQPPAQACRELVELARERGAPDNVTVQVARVRRA